MFVQGARVAPASTSEAADHSDYYGRGFQKTQHTPAACVPDSQTRQAADGGTPRDHSGENCCVRDRRLDEDDSCSDTSSDTTENEDEQDAVERADGEARAQCDNGVAVALQPPPRAALEPVKVRTCVCINRLGSICGSLQLMNGRMQPARKQLHLYRSALAPVPEPARLTTALQH